MQGDDNQISDDQLVKKLPGSEATRLKKKYATKRDTRPQRKLKAIELMASGLPPAMIADAVGLPKTTVRDLVAKFEPIFKKLPDVVDYREKKSDILAASQLAALESAFSGNKLQKAGFLSTIQGFDILNKAERLDSNQSTENHAHKFFGKLQLSNDVDPLKNN